MWGKPRMLEKKAPGGLRFFARYFCGTQDTAKILQKYLKNPKNPAPGVAPGFTPGNGQAAMAGLQERHEPPGKTPLQRLSRAYGSMVDCHRRHSPLPEEAPRKATVAGLSGTDKPETRHLPTKKVCFQVRESPVPPLWNPPVLPLPEGRYRGNMLHKIP